MYIGRSRPSRRLSPANPARGLRVRTRRCINARTPETGTNHLGGSFDSFDAKAEVQPSSGRGESKTHCYGEGVLYVHYSNQPLAQCKGRSDSFTENFFRRSHDTTLRPALARGPARRLAELRAVLILPRRSKPGSMPGNRGSSRELPHNPVLHTGRDPADRTGGECALGGPNTRPSPPSPPCRTSCARTPGSRGTGPRSCSPQPYSNTPGPGTPAGRPTADWPRTWAAATRPSAMPWQPSRRPAGSGSSTGPAIRPAGLSG